MITGNGALDIFLISVAISLTSSLLNKKLINFERLKEIKKKMDKGQEEMRQAQKEGDGKKMEEALKKQGEMAPLMNEYFSITMKPMIYTFIPFLLVFWFVKGNYSALSVTLPVLNWTLDWFWWYLLCSVVNGMIIQRLLGIKF